MRQHFGNDEDYLKDVEPGLPFVGSTKDYLFDCPNVDPGAEAVLMFQTCGVDHNKNIIQINPATAAQPTISGGIPVSPNKNAWNGNTMLIRAGVLQETDNELHIKSRNANGGDRSNIDDFIIDNVVILYKKSRIGSNSQRFNVVDYGATGDGTTDDRAAIRRAIDAAITNSGGAVFFPPGTYRLSAYLLIRDASDIKVLADGATIRYPSDDTCVGRGSIANTLPKARGAFYVLNSHRVTVQDVVFEGGTSVDRTDQQGVAIYASESTDLHLIDCATNNYGSALIYQDDTVNDRGARIIGCTSYNALNAIRTGDNGLIMGCRFEMSDVECYDRKGNSGASHAIYYFAGREDVVITGNTFRNIRVTGVKVSGTSAPIRNIVITNNVFNDCGHGVVAGADDLAFEHVNISIENNMFTNCGTNRTGWNHNGAIGILGIRSCSIMNNKFYSRGRGI